MGSKSSHRTTRLCIYSPNALEATLLAHLLESEFELESLIAVSDEEAIRCASRSTMMILHEFGRDADKLPLVRDILRANPLIELVILEGEQSIGALAYLQAGSRAYLSQATTIDDLLEKVRSAQKGESVLNPHTTGQILRRLQELARLSLDEEIDVTRCERLTGRERDVARLLAKHESNADIADSLGVSLGTVKSHVHNIMKKLDVDTRAVAGAYWRIHQEQDRGAR